MGLKEMENRVIALGGTARRGIRRPFTPSPSAIDYDSTADIPSWEVRKFTIGTSTLIVATAFKGEVCEVDGVHRDFMVHYPNVTGEVRPTWFGVNDEDLDQLLDNWTNGLREHNIA